ncbi:MAG: ADP-ribosylglycohydrolase family protein [Candidatus Spyradocola sp.]
MISFAMDYLRDRIYACWIGKNIGGTLGTPYEATRDLLDIQGFASKAGEPLPNDDLDLQLVWLRAVDELGPQNITSKALSEYWLSYVTPNWNEYGICKANLRDGLPAPLSGWVNNEEWRNSNGAWIRTEVWACLYPALVEKAIRCAYEDASVDHGLGEGTWAAIFVAAMESAAFAVSDIRSLLEIGLGKIPENCRVARSVRLVRDAYDKGVPWQQVRQSLVDDSQDLGWFQAPANVGFVVLGLLYGEGDFKRSLLLAVDCGDDTDCTGATLGALLGIRGGMAAIPEDWRAYIGDGIKSICLTNGHGAFPTDCTQLTDCVCNLLPTTLREAHSALIRGERGEVVLGQETDLSAVQPEDFCGRSFADALARRKPDSFTVEGLYADALIEFDGRPEIRPGGSLTGRVTLVPHTLPEQKNFRLRFLAPEGWEVRCPRSLFTSAEHSAFTAHAGADFTILAGENVDALNRVTLEISCPGRPVPLLVSMPILG